MRNEPSPQPRSTRLLQPVLATSEAAAVNLSLNSQRTTGFFKVRGINVDHSEFEDFMFRNTEVADFKAEVVNAGGLDELAVAQLFTSRPFRPIAALPALVW